MPTNSPEYMRAYRARKKKEAPPDVLFYDFNDPPNDGGFREVVLDIELEDRVRTGDVVVLSDEDGYRQTGRVRCLIAVVAPTGQVVYAKE